MSKALALVRFKDGTILRGCYDGTCDFLYQWLITEQELQEKYDGSIFDWVEQKTKNYDNKPINSNILTDLEEVEVFSNYGSGFSWKDKASKSKMMMENSTGIDYVRWSDDIPDWVLEYFKYKGWDYEHLIR